MCRAPSALSLSVGMQSVAARSRIALPRNLAADHGELDWNACELRRRRGQRILRKNDDVGVFSDRESAFVALLECCYRGVNRIELQCFEWREAPRLIGMARQEVHADQRTHWLGVRIGSACHENARLEQSAIRVAALKALLSEQL